MRRFYIFGYRALNFAPGTRSFRAGLGYPWLADSLNVYMEGHRVQHCYFRYVIRSNVACYFRYETLRLRITVFEEVGLLYVCQFPCVYVRILYTRIVCVVFFLFCFLLDLRYIRTFWMRFRIFVFPSDFRNIVNKKSILLGDRAPRPNRKGHFWMAVSTC